MAFDGIVIANLVHDIRQKLEGGKINKIAQPEKDELMFTVKNNKETLRLSVSASASLPLVYFTETNKPSPLTAPNFCMLLRKHIGTGRIVKVSQPGLERIIEFEIEHLDELGEDVYKRQALSAKEPAAIPQVTSTSGRMIASSTFTASPTTVFVVTN